MPDRNIVPYTAMIGSYSRSGDFDEALSLFDEMRHGGIEPSPVTLLGLFSGVSELVHVQCLHGCSISYGFQCDVSLMNSILNAYGKFGGVDDARKLFESMAQRDAVSWNSMISGFVRSGNFSEVLDLFYRMRAENIEPDKQTLAYLVSASATQSNLKLGMLLHGKLLRTGFRLDFQIQTTLIVMYMKCGSISAAFKIFELIRNKDVVLWTAMISGLVQNDCSDRALAVFQQMSNSGIKPSSATIASIVAACAKLGSFDLGKSIHCRILRLGIDLDIPAQNSLLTMYSKCGRLDQSRAIFERMRKRDLVSWNAIVAGYAQSGYLSEGLSLLSEMKSTLQKPDSLTVVSILQACASTGALHQGKWVHGFSIRSCLRPCIMVGTALVDMYSKCGDLNKARKCFDIMTEHDLVSWGTIICGYGCHGRGEDSLSLYSEFMRTGFKPDRVIFLSVLTACSHNGLVDQGLSIYKSMDKNFGVSPSLEHRACVVDLLSRAGRVEEAYEFYEKAFPEPEPDVLGIILDGCRANGDTKLGEIIAGNLLELRPSDAGNYVQLAHSFASMNRWDGVNEAWTQMRSLGLKKLPGWSFIELNGTIETFFTRHNSHPQLEEMVSTLETLRSEMRKTRAKCIDQQDS